MGKILKILLNVKKGAAPVSVESCVAIEGYGIQGDCHAGRSGREVCLRRKEILHWMESQEEKGICFDRYKENLLMEGFAGEDFMPGRRLVGEEVILEISDVPKHCFGQECQLFRLGMECRLREEYRMARIIQSGTIFIGEEIRLDE